MRKDNPSKRSRPQTSADHELAEAIMSIHRARVVPLFVRVYRASPAALAKRAERGISRELLTRLAVLLNLPAGTVGHWLGIRDHRDALRLDRDDSDRVLALASLIGRVQSLVVESGNPANFDAVRWTAGFLTNPHPALGSRRPFECMGTTQGRAMVSQLIEQQQSGAYA